MKMQVTEFGKRHWNKDFKGTKITKYTVEEFEEIINTLTPINVIEGYASFCKLFVYNNFVDVKTGTLPITLDNYQYLKSGYHSRSKEELPVLSRWFELPLKAPIANYIILVCYTKEQLRKEFEEQNPTDTMRNCIDWPKFTLNADWGIVAVLGQMGKEEEPMTPATMIRNAMGMKEGGSGVPINREKYIKSVEFWENNAMVKS